MQTSTSLVLAAAMMLNACSRGAAQDGSEQRPPVHPDPQTAATRALDTLRKLVTAANAKDMGFDDSADAASATLGDPVRVQKVRLDALRQYEAGNSHG